MSRSHQKAFQTFTMGKFFCCLVYFYFFCTKSIQPYNKLIKLDDNYTQLGLHKMVSAVSSVINNLGSHKSTVNILENVISTNENFVNSVLSFAYKDFHVGMTVSNKLQLSQNELKFSNVIVLDKTEQIKLFLANLSSSKFDFRGYYLLVVLEKLNEENFEELLKVLRKLHIINFSVVHSNKVSAFVSSFQPFEGNSCAGQFVTNELSLNTKIDELFSVKRIDLKNCPIKITSFILPPSKC